MSINKKEKVKGCMKCKKNRASGILTDIFVSSLCSYHFAYDAS